MSMGLALLATGLLLAASAAPTMAQDADEAWCAGFVDYLSVETDAALPAEATASVRDGCIAYLGATDGPVAGATAEGPGWYSQGSLR